MTLNARKRYYIAEIIDTHTIESQKMYIRTCNLFFNFLNFFLFKKSHYQSCVTSQDARNARFADVSDKKTHRLEQPQNDEPIDLNFVASMSFAMHRARLKSFNEQCNFILFFPVRRNHFQHVFSKLNTNILKET